MEEIHISLFFTVQEQLEEDVNMKKSIIYLGLLSIIVVLTGCQGAIDSLAWEDLGHGYIYHKPAGLPFIEKEHSEKGVPGCVRQALFRYCT